MRPALLAAAVLVAPAAHAGDAEGWQTVTSGAITVRARAVPGTSIREIRAEGDLNAPAQDVGVAITDASRFSKFMPYTKESRFVTEPDDAGVRVTYIRLDLPVISDRDYFLSTRTVQQLDGDGGAFVNEWKIKDDYPKRSGIVRMPANSGNWRVTPTGESSCHVVYQFLVDPGGAVPEWLADKGNRSGVPDVFKAVEQEALRLTELRKTAAKTAGPPAPR